MEPVLPVGDVSEGKEKVIIVKRWLFLFAKYQEEIEKKKPEILYFLREKESFELIRVDSVWLLDNTCFINFWTLKNDSNSWKGCPCGRYDENKSG